MSNEDERNSAPRDKKNNNGERRSQGGEQRPHRDGARDNSTSAPRAGDDRGRRDDASRSARPAEDRPYRASSDRPFGDRPYRGNSDRPRRTEGDRPARPAGDRPYRGSNDRPARSGDDRPRRNDGERPARPTTGDRPHRGGGDRPSRPAGDRPSRPAGDRPYRGNSERPARSGDGRPRRTEGDRPSRPANGDRSYRGGSGSGERPSRPAGDRPYRGNNDRTERTDNDRRDSGFSRGNDRPRFQERDGDRRPPRDERDENRPRDPEIPDAITPFDLPPSARNELKTLSKENAEQIARHLAMAAQLIDEDPEAAHTHTLAASRRAGRIAVVRESLAITAYGIGDFALALRELRTYRRISGKDDQIALMVDSERGIGRPDRALETGRAVDRSTLPVSARVALAIAMSGARLDRGELELALGELEIDELDPDRAFEWSPALFAARAAVLEDLGRDEEAAYWNNRAEVASEALGYGTDDEILIEDLSGDDVDEFGAAELVATAAPVNETVAEESPLEDAEVAKLDDSVEDES